MSDLLHHPKITSVQAAFHAGIGRPKTKAVVRDQLAAALDAIDLPRFMMEHNVWRERWDGPTKVYVCKCGADLGVESHVLLAPLARAHEAHQAAALRELVTL
jgi:hypothetical protein